MSQSVVRDRVPAASTAAVIGRGPRDAAFRAGTVGQRSTQSGAMTGFFRQQPCPRPQRSASPGSEACGPGHPAAAARLPASRRPMMALEHVVDSSEYVRGQCSATFRIARMRKVINRATSIRLWASSVRERWA